MLRGGGGVVLRPDTSEDEVCLAAADLPTDKAPTPDLIPNEIYRGGATLPHDREGLRPESI